MMRNIWYPWSERERGGEGEGGREGGKERERKVGREGVRRPLTDG